MGLCRSEIDGWSGLWGICCGPCTSRDLRPEKCFDNSAGVSLGWEWWLAMMSLKRLNALSLVCLVDGGGGGVGDNRNVVAHLFCRLC